MLASPPALTASSRSAGLPRRWLVMLVLVVLTAHLLLAGALLPDRFGFGAGDAAGPARIEVAFVRELQPAAPPEAARRLARVPRASPAPRPAASAPAATDAAVAAPRVLSGGPGAESPATPLRPADPPAEVPQSDAVAALPSLPDLSAVAPLPALAPPAFDWPPSTRLNYSLTGYFRGPVEGRASVEWLAEGGRYQVRLEISVGPPFAPLVTRRIRSDGAITPEGLAPRRYDEVTEAVLREPRALVIDFDDERVRLPGGASVPRPPGVQDSASQFVHLTWLFTTRPGLLAPGRSIELPLALPRRVDVWTYDVVGEELLATPVGEVPTLHVRPRREARRGGDLTAELWVAPTLQNLPVRIVIRQDAETWVDLLLERLPLQAVR